ncbi:Spx/MgsR family RNA polymerase-binding regulatory protein [Oceanobacillus piezotolerans]|uniref:Spx/MgsR family RNA polymerase-binding regulatory protein n=1 Tax=Oceanobacillus piezotolerans TaxID=2448030 RepID=A0A498DP10_9BACI|nr:transcriptional regulator Spx [Oceanobacillus piezotolerans]RLL45462.1 Spx/MgsR family RNA polymerase-binding regulatory protein [Oceanobacillus piezotolerans]
MVILYVTAGCTSCKKAKSWFLEHDIPFIERNVSSDILTFKEFKEILRLSDDGTDDILSTNSKVFQSIDVDLEQLGLKELYRFILKKPTLLKFPIIHDEKHFLVGYNEHQIRRFIPRSIRNALLHDAQKV